MNCYPYDEYKTLKELYTNNFSFAQAVLNYFGTSFNDVTYASTMRATFQTFMEKLCYMIYSYFLRDKIAYEDKDIFLERLTFDLAKNINHYFQLKNIDFMLGSNTDTGKYVLTSRMTNESDEKTKSGSSVVQSSASTPTGVAVKSSSQIEVDLTESGTAVSSDFSTDAYIDKYTNFQGKTDGVHKNEVDKSNEMIREGNFLNAIELMDKLPCSYLDKVLDDVSMHFVVVY